MAATSQPLATQIAIDILKAGGSAVDAAIAANAALGLMEPTGCGIGGDLFAIVWDAEKRELAGLNASGRAPQAMTIEYFRERGIDRIPKYGPLPVSVPGTVDGWFELHERYGRLPMSEILAPAIGYAREGFPVSEVIAFYMSRSVEARRAYPGFVETFMPEGRMPEKGEIFRNPRLAATYAAIAEGGRDTFYKGDIAHKIDAYMVEHGGLLRYEDLASHGSEWVDPVSTNYRGWDVYELPPNGQGVAALQILNILEGFDIASMGFGSAEYVHALVEAKKLAYEDRAKFYADMDFFDVPVERLVSKEYAAERRALISMDKAAKSLRRARRQHGVADPEQLPRHGFRNDTGRSRLRSAESGRTLRARRKTCQCTRARQATVPYDYPGFCDERRRPSDEFRTHGRRDAASGSRPDCHQYGRLRDEPAGSR
jgi:gamma-glutamyltranspeptidase/glutathione hydrolase